MALKIPEVVVVTPPSPNHDQNQPHRQCRKERKVKGGAVPQPPTFIERGVDALWRIRKLLWFLVWLYGTLKSKSSFLSDGDGRLCGWTGGNLVRSGTQELYRDVPWNWEQGRFCCDPKYKDFELAKSSAHRCRLTRCQLNIPFIPLCSALSDRIVAGETWLEYEEIQVEPCLMYFGLFHGVTAECCAKGSIQSALTSAMGAEPNEFPHMAKLRLPWGQCGGTVYNSRFILTAAHCLVNDTSPEIWTPEGVQVILGSNFGDIQAPEYIYSVKRFIPHPYYWTGKDKIVGEIPVNDIGLIELNKEIRFGPNVKALEVASKDFDPVKYAENAVKVGWGRTTVTVDTSVHLHKSTLAIRDLKSCYDKGPEHIRHLVKRLNLTEQLICFEGSYDGKWSPASSKGDSGGPAICRGPDGRALLCGINSCGPIPEESVRCMDDGNVASCYPDIFVEVAYFHDWIKEMAGEQDPSTFYKPFLFGEDVPKDKYRHQVLITSTSTTDDGDGNMKTCGGTLVAPDVVLTIARCVWEISPSYDKADIKVIATVPPSAIYNLSYHEWRQYWNYEVEGIIELSGFQHLEASSLENQLVDMTTTNFFKNDLILLKLRERVAISLSQLPILPDREIDDSPPKFGSEIQIQFSLPPTYSHVTMRSRNFRFLDKDHCQARLDRLKRFDKDIKVEANLHCGVEVYSGGSSCEREVGGGVICKGKDDGQGQDVLCGVQVFRYCESSAPSLFIDVAMYSDRIRQKLSNIYNSL